jgi:hypothetical protein
MIDFAPERAELLGPPDWQECLLALLLSAFIFCPTPR